jgi:hypothetical protein
MGRLDTVTSQNNECIQLEEKKEARLLADLEWKNFGIQPEQKKIG